MNIINFSPNSILKKCRKLAFQLLYLGLCFLYGANSALAEQMIATKGYTQTSLIINGNSTDIITKTIVGNNAFNSFSKFDVYQGKTVNLHVPSSAQNLLNIVHDKKSQIDGTLNAYKNGQIGGNVYFANPNGMVISKSGTVNVGRLTITTPTKKFVDGFFDGVGKPSATATQQLLNGTAPLNGNAKVDIQGQINSKDSTAIRSGYIDIAGEINTIPTEKIVNLTGQNGSIDIKQENGEIILFAKNDIDITGGLHADGKAGVNAGNIAVHADRNITVAEQAQLTAKGTGNNSNGGRVTVLAENNATIRDNATLNASSTGTGNAGFVEFSAKKTVDLAGGNLLTTAERGQDGTVLIDPENLIISTDLLRNQAQGTGGGISWNAGSLQLLADKKITVNSNIVISTRSVTKTANQSDRDAHINNQSTANSGDLLLKAPSIDIQNGAQLLTFADTNFQSGNIDLSAIDNAFLGRAEINIGDNVQLKSYASGNLSGGDINLDVQGIANFANVLVPVYNEKNTQATITIGSAQFDANNITVSALSNSQYALSDGAHAANLQEGSIDFLGSITPIAGVAISNADANVTVTGAAINAKGKVSIQSTALAEAKATTPSMLIGVVYGRTDVNAKTDIAGSTTIIANDNIDIGSKTNSDLAVSAIVITAAKSKSADVAIAYSTSDINTDTSIGTATQITSQKSVNVTADMSRKSSTKSTAMALEGGLAGLALSISKSNVATKADVKGAIQAGGDINITSHSNTDRNETESSVTVGTSPLIGAVIYKATNALRNKSGLFSSTTSPAALAAGVAVATHTNTTQALVSSAAKLTAKGTVAGKGNIAVNAEIKDKVQSSANASIESTERNEKKRSLSGAVNVATFNNTALAKVSNASLDAAKNISVNALIVKPYEVTWHQINGVGDIIDKINPNLGIQNGFFTSWAGNKSGGSGATAGAAVNITNYNFDSQAIIDNNAQINKDSAITGSNRQVGVTARNLIETVNLSGTFAKAGDSVNDGKFAGGGAYLEVNYGVDTKALIGNGVAVNADALKVLANATSRNVSIAGAGSSGANTAVSGSTSNLNVTDNTISNIANDAVIDLTNSSLSVQGYDAGKDGGFDPADIHYLDSTGDGQVNTNDKHVNTANNLDYGTDLSLLLAAEDEADLYNITGGVTAGKNVGIGVSVSKNTIDRNTRASIGDLAALSPYTGSVSLTGKSLLAAQNVGDIYAFSLAGAGSTGSAGNSTSTGSGKFGLAVSGDSSLNTVNDTTQAYLNNATIKKSSDVELNARSATNITAASGSAAIAVGSKKSAGIAGSYSQNTLTGSTQSFAQGVTWNNIGSLSSIAKTSGDILSISAGGSGAGTFGVAGSVSLNNIDYTTEAFGDDNNDFNLTSLDFSAENTGGIIAVGGIVAYGGKAGVGGGYTENTITNKTHAYLAHNRINISGDVSLNSTNSNTIKSYASTLGASQTASLAVSIANNNIANESLAYMDNSAFLASQPIAAHNISINALDSSDIEAVTGSISASGTGAVGAAWSNNEIANTSKAYMRNMAYQQEIHNIDINASNTNSILAVTYSVGASKSLLGAGGAVAVNRVNNDTESYLNGQYTNVLANDILINANSQATIKNIAVAAAGANGVGIGGSISTNFIGNTTDSYINEGAQIKAEDDLAVLANNDDKLSVASGSAGIGIDGAGIGLSILTNEISGDTNAYISGIGTKVSAMGKNTSDNLSVNNGQLASTVNLGQQVDLASYSTLDLKNNKQNKTVNGLAVNAGSTQQIEAIAVNVGAGDIGIGLIENVNLIAGNTRAYLENTSINESLSGAGLTQQVDVMASNHSYINDFVGNVTAGAAGGVGFGEDLTTIARGVYAYGRNSTINSQGELNINALATQGISSLAIGGAGGGTVGFTGTGVLAQFKGETKSYLDTVFVNADSVNVIADSQEDLFLVSGAAGVAGEGAAGGSFAVGINGSTTQAYIKGNTTRSKVTAQNDVNVKASSSTHINNYSIAGAGAGGVGVAGSVAVNIVKNTVEADIDKTDIGTSISKVASIDVATKNDVNIKTRAGAGGLGSSLGIGAGAVVNILKSRSVANVSDSKLYTSGLLNIAADSQNDIDSLAVMVGGGAVGIGGAVAVNMVGDNLSTESGDELDKDNKGTLTKVDDFTNKDRFEKLQGSDNKVMTAGEKSRINAGAQGDVKDIANGSDATHLKYQTAANVSTNTIIDAGSLTITAKDLTKIKSVVGSGGIGAIGVGGAVAVSSYKANVNAIVDNTSQVTTSGNMTISAQVDNDGHDTLDQETWAGVAGAIGLGAAVTHATIANNINAGIAGTTQVGTGSLTVIAEDKSTISSKALGAQVGALTAGAVVSRATKQSDVNASLANNLSITSGNSTITADNIGKVYAEAEAAAGGLQGSGIGADARAEDKSTVSAVTAANSTINLQHGGLYVTANASPEVEAKAEGINVSLGVRVGVSNAFAKATTTVDAHLADHNTITANDLLVISKVTQNNSADSAKARAFAAGGGLLIGVGATYSDASSHLTSNSFVGDNSSLTVTGQMDINSMINSKQYADADGYNGGLLALGFNESHATSDTKTQAILGANTTVTGGNLTVASTGEDNNFAQAISGSGGLIGGSSAKAFTNNSSETDAYINSGVINVDQFVLKGEHTATFNSAVDSSFGSVFGGSGAYANNNQTSDVLVAFRPNVAITAKNIDVNATNKVRKNWLAGGNYNVLSGSGGVVDAPAGTSHTDLNLTTLITVADNDTLNVVGDRLHPGELAISALNDVLAKDKVKLDSGGVLPIALVESKITNDINDANVKVANAELRSVGDISLSARNKTDIKSQADAKTYGLSGVALGTTLSRVVAHNGVLIKSGAYLRADGNMKILAGQDKTGASNDFKVVARTDLWNKTAIPFWTDPKADAKLTQTNTIEIQNGAELGSVKNSYLLADEGSVLVEGKGIGKDAYRTALAAVANAFRRLAGEDEISFDIHGGSSSTISQSKVLNNGIVKAGIQNKQYLTIQKDGTVDLTVPQGKSDGVNFTRTNENLSNNIDAQIAQYEQLKLDFSDLPDVVAAYQAEIDRLNAQKSQLAGLNTNVGFITVDGIFAQSSNIFIQADNLSGTGKLEAPGDTLIQIKNHSANFLRTKWLMIPENSGGRITFNNIQVHNNAEINARNQGATASFNSVVTSKNSSAPLIHVENTYRPGSGGNPAGIEPDIEITGDITNLRGTVEVINKAGSVNVGGNIIANTIDIQAGKDLVLSYVDGFRHLGGDPKTHWADVANVDEANKIDRAILNKIKSGGSTLIAGNNIFASAKILNINGLIQSGLPDNFITIDSAPKITAGSRNLAWARSNYLSKVASNPTVSEYYRIEASAGDTIDAFYNAKLDRIELQDVKVQGGYMQLFGQIISTGAGKLKVLDGFGRINIANNSAKSLVLAQLDVGTQREGQIKITDTNFRGENNQPLTTWYRRLGNQISVWDSTTVDANGNPNNLVRYETAGQKNTRYSPKTGQYFSWLKREKRTTTKKKTEYKLTCFYVTGCSEDSSTSNGPTTHSAPTFVRGDLVLNYDKNSSAYNGTVNKWNDYWYDNTYLQSNTGWVKTGSKTKTTKTTIKIAGVSTSIDWYKEKWKYYTKKIYDTWYHQHNVKAFHDIAINFIGYDTAKLNVASTGNILINGGLNNSTGITSLSTLGSIEQLTPNASIGGQNINLAAVTGIGNNSTIKTNLNGGQLLALTQTGNITLSETLGDLNYKKLQTNNGDISITVDGSLSRANGLALIKANKIDLTSTYGDIGSAGNRIIIDSGSNMANGDGLNASAAKDIYLTEQSGDLLLNTVNARGGNADITVSTGSLIDVNPNETRDTRTEAELLSLWNDMQLVGTVGTDEASYAAKTIQGFENTKTSNYQRYWQYRSRQADPTVYDANFAIVSTADEINAFKQQDWTDQQINTFDQQRSQQYHALNSDFAMLGDSFDKNYQYHATADDIAGLSQGSVWTTNQLKFAIGGGLLKETSDTNARIEDPNLVGINVKLNIANKVGRTLNDIVIDNTPATLNLTDQQRIALASAEAGDISISNSEIRIKQRDNVNIDARDSLKVDAGQDIYIGSEKDINVDHIRSASQGNIIIKSGQGIYNVAGNATTNNIDGGAIILEAARGSLGSASAPILYTSANNITARTGQDMYLKSNGDMLISTLYARNKIQLGANNFIDALNTDNTNIRSHSLDLTATDAIGNNTNALDIALDSDGLLTAIATAGSVNIATPDRGLTIGNIQSAGDIKLKANGDIINGRTDDNVMLTGNNFTLTSTSGQVGSAGKSIIGDANGVVNINAETGIFYEERNGDLTSNWMISNTGPVDINVASGNGQFDTISTLGAVNVGVSGGTLNIDTVNAGSAIFKVAEESGVLDIRDLQVKDRLEVAADVIHLPLVTHTGTVNKLRLNLSGNDAGIADEININVNSSIGTFYEKLSTKDIKLSSSSGNIDLSNFTVDGFAEIKLPNYSVVIYNGIPRLFPDADIQLAGGSPINLIIRAGSKLISTNAMVVDYKPNYIINHFSSENSLARLGEKRSAQQVQPKTDFLIDTLYPLLGTDKPLKTWLNDRREDVLIYDPELLVQATESLPSIVAIQ